MTDKPKTTTARGPAKSTPRAASTPTAGPLVTAPPMPELDAKREAAEKARGSLELNDADRGVDVVVHDQARIADAEDRNAELIASGVNDARGYIGLDGAETKGLNEYQRPTY